MHANVFVSETVTPHVQAVDVCICSQCTAVYSLQRQRVDTGEQQLATERKPSAVGHARTQCFSLRRCCRSDDAKCESRPLINDTLTKQAHRITRSYQMQTNVPPWQHTPTLEGKHQHRLAAPQIPRPTPQDSEEGWLLRH